MLVAYPRWAAEDRRVSVDPHSAVGARRYASAVCTKVVSCSEPTPGVLLKPKASTI